MKKLENALWNAGIRSLPRYYLCECHNKQARQHKITTEDGHSLGTWLCPVTGRKAKVHAIRKAAEQ